MREEMTGTEREPSEWGPGTDTLAPMRAVAAFATQTQAEVARALLEDEGIIAQVGDWSAMRELADYRVLVADEDIVAAAEILGVDAPAVPEPLPAWVRLGMIGVAVAMALFIVWALVTQA
jgi:hypothetical protein